MSRYYKFRHPRGSRLSFAGLHTLIRGLTAELEGVDRMECQVVESHYFRGWFPASEVEAAGKLKEQAVFDEMLLRAGVIPHYLPLSTTLDGLTKEQGIDVWLAFESYDLAVHKGFDVLALVAWDGDFTPPVRKMSSLGIRTLLLAWDFAYEYEPVPGQTRPRETHTAQNLIEASRSAAGMGPLIDETLAAGDPLAEELFVQ